MIDFDFSKKEGNVLFDDFNINEDDNMEDHIYDLKEDMLQVDFFGKYLLDVGWRPSFDLDGQFFITIVENYNWEEPKYLETASSISELKSRLILALNEIIKN